MADRPQHTAGTVRSTQRRSIGPGRSSLETTLQLDILPTRNGSLFDSRQSQIRLERESRRSDPGIERIRTSRSETRSTRPDRNRTMESGSHRRERSPRSSHDSRKILGLRTRCRLRALPERQRGRKSRPKRAQSLAGPRPTFALSRGPHPRRSTEGGLLSD
jgi:hypothetical protein